MLRYLRSCRVQDEQAVTYRTLQLELSTLKEENSRFKDELSKSMASMEAQQTALEAAQEETARVGQISMDSQS